MDDHPWMIIRSHFGSSHFGSRLARGVSHRARVWHDGAAIEGSTGLAKATRWVHVLNRQSFLCASLDFWSAHLEQNSVSAGSIVGILIECSNDCQRFGNRVLTRGTSTEIFSRAQQQSTSLSLLLVLCQVALAPEILADESL